MLYNSLFLSHLNYCCEVWANTYKTNLYKIIMLQKKVIRIIYKVDRYSHTSSLFSEMHTLKFLDIVKYKSVLVMFKAYTNTLPYNLQSYFSKNNVDENYSLRSVDKFKIKYTRTSLKANCVTVRGPKLWNDLPKSVTSIQNPIRFKKALKFELLKSYLHKE